MTSSIESKRHKRPDCIDWVHINQDIFLILETIWDKSWFNGKRTGFEARTPDIVCPFIRLVILGKVFSYRKLWFPPLEDEENNEI